MNPSGDLFELALAAERLADYRRHAEMARLARRAAGCRRSPPGHLMALLLALATCLDPLAAPRPSQPPRCLQ
jgi:hypothetical protein